ncbi:unnamed protein product [Sphagnum tenellum]
MASPKKNGSLDSSNLELKPKKNCTQVIRSRPAGCNKTCNKAAVIAELQNQLKKERATRRESAAAVTKNCNKEIAEVQDQMLKLLRAEQAAVAKLTEELQSCQRIKNVLSGTGYVARK